MNTLELLLFFLFCLWQTFISGVVDDNTTFEPFMAQLSFVGMICFGLGIFGFWYQLVFIRRFQNKVVPTLIFFIVLNLLIGLVQRQHFMSKKEMNKMVHALNGNIIGRFLLILIILTILALPLGMLELALGERFPAFARWRFTWRNSAHTLWCYFANSRFGFVFGAALFVLSPVVFFITTAFSYGILLYKLYLNFRFPLQPQRVAEAVLDDEKLRRKQKRNASMFRAIPEDDEQGPVTGYVDAADNQLPFNDDDGIVLSDERTQT